MKKLFLGTITTILLLAIVLPLTVNAATLKLLTPGEISAGETVEIEVKTSSKVESIQFDVEFNPDQYEYVIDSAKSDLKETDSNYIATNQVRVSAYDVANADGTQPVADTVTMKFKAKTTASGTDSFKIGAVEVDENGRTETVANGEVQVKINGIENGNSDSEKYVDEDGKKVTIGQWGYIPPIRIYDDLIIGQNVVVYALPYSDDVIKVTDLEAEFGKQITVSGANAGIVGTGDTFTLNSQTYTILIYGDVNGDGKVTTADALTTTKNAGTLSPIKELALDVVKKSNAKTNAKAQQQFILKKQYGTVKKYDYPLIIDAYPEEVGEAQEIDLIQGLNKSTDVQTGELKYRYTEFKLATVSSNNNVAIANADALTYEVKKDGIAVSEDIAKITYSPDSNGAFLMKLYATVAGDYTITPIVVGNNVASGVKRGEAIQITVSEDPEITEIQVTGLKEDGKAYATTGKTKTVGLNFVHRYANGEEGSVPVEKNSIEITKIEEQYISKADTYFEVENEKVTGLVIKANDLEIDETTLEIAVTDENGKTTKKEIKVKIEESPTEGIVFNGATILSQGATAKTVTLYRDTIKAADDTNETREYTIQQSGTNTTSLIAILPIQLVKDGKPTSVRYGDIVEEGLTNANGTIGIYETADSQYKTTADIVIKYYSRVDDKYEPVLNPVADSKVDAIGIALSPTIHEEVDPDGDPGKTGIDYLSQGLTIQYDTLAGRGELNIPVRIFEDGKNLLEQNNANTVSSDDEVEVEENKVTTTSTPVVEPETSTKQITKSTNSEVQIEKPTTEETPAVPEETVEPSTPVVEPETKPVVTETPEVKPTEPETPIQGEAEVTDEE